MKNCNFLSFVLVLYFTILASTYFMYNISLYIMYINLLFLRNIIYFHFYYDVLGLLSQCFIL